MNYKLWGILNLTPDSFSDGLPKATVNDFLKRAEDLIHQGADILDVGAESTRPDSVFISYQEELDRLLPFLEVFRQRYKDFPISLDTKKYQVALEAMPFGIQYLNDVSFMADERLPLLAKHADIPYVLMHTRGNHQEMKHNTDYGPDFFKTLQTQIEAKLLLLKEWGIEKLLVDPGFGFAKTPEQCQLMMNHLDFWKGFDTPLLLGISRKRFLRLGQPDLSVADLDQLSAQGALKAFDHGFRHFRVHQVGLHKKSFDQRIQMTLDEKHE